MQKIVKKQTHPNEMNRFCEQNSYLIYIHRLTSSTLASPITNCIETRCSKQNFIAATDPFLHRHKIRCEANLCKLAKKLLNSKTCSFDSFVRFIFIHDFYLLYNSVHILTNFAESKHWCCTTKKTIAQSLVEQVNGTCSGVVLSIAGVQSLPQTCNALK